MDRYQILNVRVGGPYTVTVSLAGFRERMVTGVMVALGEDKAVDVVLELATLTETVTVTAQVPLIDTVRAGTAAASRAPSAARSCSPTQTWAISGI